MKTFNELQQNKRLQIVNITSDGGNGFLLFHGKKFATVVWSYGGGWEHVSIAPLVRKIVPSWKDMCMLKDMFFREDEVVVQYHPRKSDYVNQLSNCLHLWRPIDQEIPTPPPIMVGIKAGQTAAEVLDAIREVSL